MQLFEAHCKQSRSKTYLRSANGRAFLACYFADEKDLLPFYPLHSHEELEIVLVESGSADICCNGDCATVHCGDIFIVPPFSSHAIAVHDGDVKLAALVYNFRLAAGNEYVRLGQYAACSTQVEAACCCATVVTKNARKSQYVLQKSCTRHRNLTTNRWWSACDNCLSNTPLCRMRTTTYLATNASTPCKAHCVTSPPITPRGFPSPTSPTTADTASFI